MNSLVGGTPVVRLSRESNGCSIFGKCEHLGVFGSIKDRPAKFIIDDALASGALLPGGTIVEATAGNTGIALALYARSLRLNLKTVFFVPESLAVEKIEILRAISSEVILCPLVPLGEPQNYRTSAIRFAKEGGHLNADQFHNLANLRSHYETTGPEIFREMVEVRGVDPERLAFICAAGTGGTIAGISRALKELSGGKAKVFSADIRGSAVLDFVQSKGQSCKVTEGKSINEGIGNGTITENMKAALPYLDGALLVEDAEAIRECLEVLRDDGIWVGPSAGANIAAARALAHKLEPGFTIVTILCDSGTRYVTKVFNTSWRVANNVDVEGF
jgi:cysteine synthase A